jgi:hypothetical protein
MQESMQLAYDESLLLQAYKEENLRLKQQNLLLQLQSSAPPGLAPPPGLDLPQMPHNAKDPSPIWQAAESGLWPGALYPSDINKGSGAVDASTVAGSSAKASPNSSRHSSRVSSLDGDAAPPGKWAVRAPPPGEWKSRPAQAGAQKTTLMLKNLPNDYTREMLVELLNAQGCEGSFDFVYLPIDFERDSGLGYAFVNFVGHEVAEAFLRRMSGFKGWSIASSKVCEALWSNSMQGLQAHIERYRNSPVMHDSVPEYYRPVLFSGTTRLPFPPPTKKITAPRHWHRRR